MSGEKRRGKRGDEEKRGVVKRWAVVEGAGKREGVKGAYEKMSGEEVVAESAMKRKCGKERSGERGDGEKSGWCRSVGECLL